MGHHTKMFLRLAAPAVLSFVGGMLLATVADSVAGLPMLMGGKPTLDNLGNEVALGAGCVSLIVYAVQMVRYWRWTRDEGDVCFVCSCLLGRERDGRFGPYRKCLGCGKNHAVGGI